MRLAFALLVVLFALWAGVVPARAALRGRIDVRGPLLELYTSPLLLAAEGGVTVRTGGRILRADELRYDLQKNRLVARGNVTVSGKGGDVSADVYALDVPGDSATALKLLPLPATFLIHDGNAAQAVEAPPPAGAFEVAGIAGLRPYLRGAHAVIVPNVSVRFAPARVETEAAGTYVPSPAYLYTFASNPSFTTQALPGATFDQPYNLVGNSNSLLAAHFRYDTTDGATVGFDEHLVDGTKAYAVGSVLPLVDHGRFDLNAFEQLTPKLTQQVFGTHFEGFNSFQYLLSHSERASNTSLVWQQVDGSQTADLRLRTLEHHIPHFISYVLSAGVGYDHAPGLLPYASDLRSTFEALFEVPSLRGPFGTTLQPSVDLQTSFYNFPRQRGSAVDRIAISRTLTPVLSFYGFAQIVQNYDRYRTGLRYFYPATGITLPDGTYYAGYAAYAGTGTQRTYFAQATYQPSTRFNLILSLTHDRDFPQFDGFGVPPYQFGFDVRLRPSRWPSVEFGRAYVFGWGGQGFTPQYTLGISP